MRWRRTGVRIDLACPRLAGPCHGCGVVSDATPHRGQLLRCTNADPDALALSTGFVLGRVARRGSRRAESEELQVRKPGYASAVYIDRQERK